MTKFLRTTSTRRLLAVIAGLLVAIAAGTAIAVAAGGSGPEPARAPLANAIHRAVGAPQIQGISARVTFTNHLIDASNMQGSDPLLTGATGRLWLSSDHRLRLELQSDNGDAQVVVNNGSFSVYDPTSNTVYEGPLPSQPAHKSTTTPDTLPSLASIQKDINQLAQHLTLSGAIPSDVAGQPAYTVRISPKHDGGQLLGAAEIAWDAVRGVPLRLAVYASGNSSPVLELQATDISYGAVPASDLTVSPPGGAKVVKVATPNGQQTGSATSERRDGAGRHQTAVTGTAAVARKVPFALVAPRSLAGFKQRSVTLLDWNHSPTALVAYGQGIGGIAVIEQTATKPAASSQSSSAGSDHQGLSLPTVSINGATGQELDTALGTMIRFTRAGVSYTVLGSVPRSAAELAARGL